MSRDLRQYTRQTNRRLMIGFLVLVFLVGGGLIYILYGRGAGITGFFCLLGALVPVLLVVMLLWLLDRVVKGRE